MPFAKSLAEATGLSVFMSAGLNDFLSLARDKTGDIYSEVYISLRILVIHGVQ